MCDAMEYTNVEWKVYAIFLRLNIPHWIFQPPVAQVCII
jgi:hypothetical protein